MGGGLEQPVAGLVLLAFQQMPQVEPFEEMPEIERSLEMPSEDLEAQVRVEYL
jgi:hypothetical protein